MAKFTLIGEVGELEITVSLEHPDTARLRTGTARITRQILDELVTVSLDEKKSAMEPLRRRRRFQSTAIETVKPDEDDDAEEDDI